MWTSLFEAQQEVCDFFFNNLDLGKTAVVQYITDTTI